MKLFYFTQYDIRWPRTNANADMRMCEGFAQNGCEVELTFPSIFRPQNLRMEELFDSYGIVTKFKLRLLKTPIKYNTAERLQVLIKTIASVFVFVHSIVKYFLELEKLVFMSRDPNLLIPFILFKKFFLLNRGPKIIVWAHEIIISKRTYVWVYLNASGIVGTNSAIINDLNQKLGIPFRKLAVSLNPITNRQLQDVLTKREARRFLCFESDKPLVVYTGATPEMETQYILLAASELPAYSFYIVGANSTRAAALKNWCIRRNITNVQFVPFLKNYKDVSQYQYAADVLISYYSKHDHLVKYNLPNKICEYMLTRNPIVTWRLPSIVDVLNESNAIFAEPESPVALAVGIKNAIMNKSESAKIAQKAYDDVRKMTYSQRARILIDFFKTL